MTERESRPKAARGTRKDSGEIVQPGGASAAVKESTAHPSYQAENGEGDAEYLKLAL